MIHYYSSVDNNINHGYNHEGKYDNSNDDKYINDNGNKHDNNFKQSKDLREDRGIRQLKASPKSQSARGGR